MRHMAKSFDIALFNSSDGLTPIQVKKLNQNFQRLQEIASGKDENSEAVVRVASAVQESLMPIIMDSAYPIGCLILAKDADALPKWGEWQEVTSYNNRFIRIAGTYGSTGGAASQIVAPTLPEHTHTYRKQVAGDKVKVDASTKDSAKEVLATIKDATTTTDTSAAGTDSTGQSISTIPPFVTMRLFERIK